MDSSIAYATNDSLCVYQGIGLGRMVVEHVSSPSEPAKSAFGSLDSPVDPEKLPRLVRVQRHGALYHVA